jgi:hypothetical protein
VTERDSHIVQQQEGPRADAVGREAARQAEEALLLGFVSVCCMNTASSLKASTCSRVRLLARRRRDPAPARPILNPSSLPHSWPSGGRSITAGSNSWTSSNAHGYSRDPTCTHGI